MLHQRLLYDTEHLQAWNSRGRTELLVGSFSTGEGSAVWLACRVCTNAIHRRSVALHALPHAMVLWCGHLTVRAAMRCILRRAVVSCCGPDRSLLSFVAWTYMPRQFFMTRDMLCKSVLAPGCVCLTMLSCLNVYLQMPCMTKCVMLPHPVFFHRCGVHWFLLGFTEPAVPLQVICSSHTTVVSSTTLQAAVACPATSA